ncbi:hypothetical protein QVD17_06422 [Tagetes erecta]|uniref:Uncharacterized protein n=1 Tax=Tagetes erecta TaxID=13708 RepID=A0AAD8LFZ6_TARER|nr:hypothetical protein QVD17_06422 [Tagetes erecta]
MGKKSVLIFSLEITVLHEILEQTIEEDTNHLSHRLFGSGRHEDDCTLFRSAERCLVFEESQSSPGMESEVCMEVLDPVTLFGSKVKFVFTK